MIGLSLLDLAPIDAKQSKRGSLYKTPYKVDNLFFDSCQIFYDSKKIFKLKKIENISFKYTKFSTTTKISGNLNFVSGAVRNALKGEALHSTYEYKLKLLSSFNGRDSLVAKFEAGNALQSSLELDLQSSKGNEIEPTNIYYQFPLENNLIITLGPKMFGYQGLAGTSTAYNERIAILDGSNYSTDAGNSAALAISYLNNNGLNSTIKLSAKNSNNANKGMFTGNSDDSIIGQIGFTGRDYGGTFTYNYSDKFKAYGIGIYLKPDNLPSLSASIELKSQSNSEDIKNWLIAILYNNMLGSFGSGLGTYNTNEDLAYETWYEIDITDNLSLIPILFVKTSGNSITKEDELGFALNAKYNF